MFSVSLLFLILFQLSVFFFLRISFLPYSLFLLAIFCKTYLSQIIGNIVSCLGIWNKSLLSNVSWKLNLHRSNSSFIARLCFIIYSCSLFLQDFLFYYLFLFCKIFCFIIFSCSLILQDFLFYYLFLFCKIFCFIIFSCSLILQDFLFYYLFPLQDCFIICSYNLIL